MIKINKINKFYNKNKINQLHVLKDICLELPEKGLIALFGRSGCGKSTLFNLIGGLDNYENGSISILDQDIRKNTDLLRNKNIGYIFQNYHLLNNISCYENVATSLRLCGIEDEELIKELVIQALKNVGMEKYVKRTPSTLSGGQQQRIAIARAIVKNPKIILADEPTGNLDDSNTVLVMDLLKEISKEHLVLLITHEEKLVDHYCDKIINLSDGKVVDIVDNESEKEGYSNKDNNIYLGEYEKKENLLENMRIEYYGNNLEKPINIKIINNNGKVYIKFDDPNIKVIDKSSEIKLKEGKFEPKVTKNKKEIIIKDIPYVDDKKYGKLFTLKDSIKKGFINLVKKRKSRIEKIMHFVLVLFAIVTVIFSAIFGTAFSKIEEVEGKYDHNIFYLRVTSDELCDQLNQAVKNKEHGISYSQVSYNQANEGFLTEFKMAGFETIKPYLGLKYMFLQYLSNELVKDNEVLAGKIDNLEKHEIVISSQVADLIINQSSYGNIKDYDDLIGWFSPSIEANGKIGYIAGVVKNDNTAMFIDDDLLADKIYENSNMPIKKASDFDFTISQGEVIYLNVNNDAPSYISQGGKVSINGKELAVKEILNKHTSYSSYLEEHSPSLLNETDFYIDKMILEYPSLSEEEIKASYKLYIDDIREKYYFDYLDYYYQNYDQYMNHLYLFDKSNFYVWLYEEKDIELAKYYTMSGGISYYACKEYKEINGNYPTIQESEEISTDSYYSKLNNYQTEYRDEFDSIRYAQILQDIYLLSDQDYNLFSKQSGYTSEFIKELIHEYSPRYLLIYSNDVEKTFDYLNSIIEERDINDGYDLLLSPTLSRERLLNEVENDITVNLIAIIVLMSIMSVCMYFIMRSSTMNRIKEIGIYRAIGVTKKNFIFKFVIETLVLITTTVLVGYLLSSGFVWISQGLTPQMGSILYYPWYISITLLVVLYLVTLVCGILPVVLLLRKTPSEILAKYDI